MNLDIYSRDLMSDVYAHHQGVVVNARKWLDHKEKIVWSPDGMPAFQLAPRDAHTKKGAKVCWDSRIGEFVCDCTHYNANKDKPLAEHLCAHIYAVVNLLKYHAHYLSERGTNYGIRQPEYQQSAAGGAEIRAELPAR